MQTQFIKKLIVIFAVVLSAFSYGQEKKKTQSKNSKADQPFYRTKNSDIFYIGVDNLFTLYKDPAKKYSITVKNGALVEKASSSDSTVYVISVKNPEPTFVNVMVDNKLFVYKFRNRRIPSPEIKIMLGAEFSKVTEIDLEKFMTAKNLSLELTDFDFDVAMKIVGMQLVIVRNGQKQEHLLTDQRIENFTKSCLAGDIFIFKDVVVEFTQTGTQRTISGKTYFVK